MQEEEKEIMIDTNEEESKEPKKEQKSEDNNVNVVTCKHFPISDTESYVEFSTQMSESRYEQITEGECEANVEPGKNKLLIQCLDISGSMGGSIPSLKEGCK